MAANELQVLDLNKVAAPFAICDPEGTVLAAASGCAGLLERFAKSDRLPHGLWRALRASDCGESVEWRPLDDPETVLGCTRYAHERGFLVLLKELTGKQAVLSRRLHRQRLEATGRIVASVAHELRNSVASINYSTDYLRFAVQNLSEQEFDEATLDILSASGRLQSLVDGLLDYARLGPTISVRVSLRDVMARAQGFLRGALRRGEHELEVNIPEDATFVQGNSIIVEQVFVNLILNAIQASNRPLHVRVVATLESDESIIVRVSDNGPGVPNAVRESIFLPFFTTRDEGTGLGLPTAREATESMGGRLMLERPSTGSCFAVHLPMADS